MKPLVSILIPAFNAEEWISATIESALAQTWTEKEIIIVDDGSTDETAAIARRFSSHVVSVITQENQGAAAARNKALGICQGDYIQWLDADDLLAPEKIAKQMVALEDCRGQRTLVSSAWGSFFYRPQRADFTPTTLWCDLAPVEWLLRNLGNNHWMQPAAWLVSRELTHAAGPWDARLSLDDDGEYFCRVVAASDRVRFSPEARVFYRRRLDSLSYIGRSNRKLESQFLSITLQISHARSIEDSERVRSACVKCLQRYLIYFYPERPDLVKRAEQVALALGGELETPRLHWKYVWIQQVFGWAAAKESQLYYNRFKTSLIGFWDKALSELEKRKVKRNGRSW
jgi:glycosyltransferase involved in cell wall biosynthesis